METLIKKRIILYLVVFVGSSQPFFTILGSGKSVKLQNKCLSFYSMDPSKPKNTPKKERKVLYARGARIIKGTNNAPVVSQNFFDNEIKDNPIVFIPETALPLKEKSAAMVCRSVLWKPVQDFTTEELKNFLTEKNAYKGDCNSQSTGIENPVTIIQEQYTPNTPKKRVSQSTEDRELTKKRKELWQAFDQKKNQTSI